MSIRVALTHITHYKYDRLIRMSPHVVRLRPAPHTRTPILSYRLKVAPEKHFLNWQQDPYSNYLARLAFPEPAAELRVEVGLVAEMTVINPFDFFVETAAEKYPFQYESVLQKELQPYLHAGPAGCELSRLVALHQKKKLRSIDFLVEINRDIHQRLKYTVRLEPGVQSPEETLRLKQGSCRDFAWLQVNLMRHLGLAARFVSGYLIQLVADVKPLDGPAGTPVDFTDLHAWTEVYLPGAGWIGLDATSGLLTGEGHIPLACTAEPSSAAPVSGLVDECKTEFSFDMTVKRIYETPRVTKPYKQEQWTQIALTGQRVDDDAVAADIRMTMGGEPTFVSIDDMDGPEWNSAALGPKKKLLGAELLKRLQKRFAPGGLLHHGQGKWYPGESLPRWSFACFWRKDGQPIWNDPQLIADEANTSLYDSVHARRFINALIERLGEGAASEHILPAYEDVWYYLWKERRLPVNVNPLDNKIDNPEDRARLARVFEAGLDKVVGYALPVRNIGSAGSGFWQTGAWFFRPEKMFLIPGDSPIGYRLPLDSLPWVGKVDYPYTYPRDPMEKLPPLPRTARQGFIRRAPSTVQPLGFREQTADDYISPDGSMSPEMLKEYRRLLAASSTENVEPGKPAPWIIRTAICVEPRNGVLRIFMPPLRYAEDYIDLVARIEDTARALNMPVMFEGYPPPPDPRLNVLKVTPDPGVIEVNIHPASTWQEAIDITTGLYDDAHHTRLGTENFMLDGRHSGTGGGNHIVVGGTTPADSPFLRRPDLLRSLLTFWHNHPSLSYLFSGLFIGPTSQAPRVDEGRADNTYELQLANEQIARQGRHTPAWTVDRIYRNLLVDLTGNTHRAEFCIDKLYSPDTSSGRLGLVEFRGFEMPPHPHMSLAQQLLIRALISEFWHRPYSAELVRWGTQLHDRFLLPHFVEEDFRDVLNSIKGYNLSPEWFAPHLEFRFPMIGEFTAPHMGGVEVQLRQAIEPWNVLGEEPGGGGTVRYVDSSLERLEIKARGLIDGRHALACNTIEIPLHPTGAQGEYVAGIRYRAWQPAACLHPTIGIHTPLIFDLVDKWNGRSVGGCTYHITHPGGRSYDTFPVNGFEAQARRAARFFKFGHTPGELRIKIAGRSKDFPLTLDLRRV